MEIEYIVGPDETTLWLWPNDPDPVTTTINSRTWATIERTADEQNISPTDAIQRIVADRLEPNG